MAYLESITAIKIECKANVDAIGKTAGTTKENGGWAYEVESTERRESLACFLLRRLLSRGFEDDYGS